MLSDVLQPPNIELLSEDIIGHAMQRTRSLRHSVDAQLLNRGGERSGTRRRCHNGPHRDTTTAVGSAPPSKRIKQSTSTVVLSERLSSMVDALQLVDGKVSSSVPDRNAAQGLLFDNVREYQRERHRCNQERYRQKQQQRFRNLEEGTHVLREEVQHLTRRRNSLFIGNRVEVTKESVVIEYFRVFRRGFVKPEGSRVVELDFLRAMMAPDLDAGTVFGFEELAKSWGVFSQFFQDVQVKLEHFENTSVGSIVASTSTSVTITRSTLRDAFQDVTRDSCIEHARWTRIADKLLGKRLSIRGTVRFSWDKRTNRVIRLISHADMVSPLLRLLGSLEDVVTAFGNARITPECNLVAGDYLLQFLLYC